LYRINVFHFVKLILKTIHANDAIKGFLRR
jgi:hypothetical protein